jgi:hypothetical protein
VALVERSTDKHSGVLCSVQIFKQNNRRKNRRTQNRTQNNTEVLNRTQNRTVSFVALCSTEKQKQAETAAPITVDDGLESRSVEGVCCLLGGRCHRVVRCHRLIVCPRLIAAVASSFWVFNITFFCPLLRQSRPMPQNRTEQNSTDYVCLCGISES